MPSNVTPAQRAAGLRELADIVEHLEPGRCSDSWDTSVIVFPRSLAETLYLTEGRSWRRDQGHDTSLRRCIDIELPGRVHVLVYVPDAVLAEFDAVHDIHIGSLS